MAKVYKRVNIVAKSPILSLNPPIRGTVRNTKLTVEQIRACIMGRAIVDEVLKDGSTVRLTLANYNKDNNPVVPTIVVEPDMPPKAPVREYYEDELEEEEEPENEVVRAIKAKIATTHGIEIDDNSESLIDEDLVSNDGYYDDEEEDDMVSEVVNEEVVEDEVEEDIEETVEEGPTDDEDDDDVETLDLSELGL